MTEPLDDDYLMEFARTQQSEAARRQYLESAKCPACKHQEHGVVCSFTGTYTTCTCPSSYWGRAS